MTALAINPMGIVGGQQGALIHSPGMERGLQEAPPVLVPHGWRRQLVDGRIVYSSPTDCLLWCMNDAVQYLMTDGTCKCGLECPFHVQDLFNFDPTSLLQIHASLEDDQQSTSHTFCHHKKKLRQTFQNNNAFYAKQVMDERHFRQQLHEQQLQRHHPRIQAEYQQQEGHHFRRQQLHQHNNRPQGEHYPVNYSNHPNFNHQEHVVIQGHPGDLYHHNQGMSFSYHEGEHVPRHPIHHQEVMMDKRLHQDVTAVTNSITDAIPSVGQMIPVGHRRNMQPPPAHQHRSGHHQPQTVHPQDHQVHPGNYPGHHSHHPSGHQPGHHHGHQQQPQHVHYGVIPQQPILLMPQNDQMLLSPQVVSSFTHSSVNHHHEMDQHQHQQQHMNHQQFVMHPHTMMVPQTGPVKQPVFDRKKPRKRNPGQFDKSKRGKTVAAILNLSM